jgi:hypothetical protein
MYNHNTKGGESMKEKQPLILNDRKSLFSPKVPGQYNPEMSIRVTSNNEPVVFKTKGIMGTTRTGEHATEC